MKTIFIFFKVLYSITVFAQNDISKDIKRVISDSSNKFSSFKKGLKYSIDDDFVYNSTLTIKGTKENEISVNRLASEYRAVISDSLKKEEAQKLIMQWKERMILILGNKIKIENIKAAPDALVIGGYMFNVGMITVFLSQSRQFKNLYQVDLSFLILNVSF